MMIHLLVYVIAVIHASPHNNVRDNLFLQDSIGDLSAAFDPAGTDIFDDGTLVSSAAPPNDDARDGLFLSPMNTDSSDAIDFW